MVDVVTSSKRSAVNRINKQLFPTAESPTKRTCANERQDKCSSSKLVCQPRTLQLAWLAGCQRVRP